MADFILVQELLVLPVNLRGVIFAFFKKLFFSFLPSRWICLWSKLVWSALISWVYILLFLMINWCPIVSLNLLRSMIFWLVIPATTTTLSRTSSVSSKRPLIISLVNILLHRNFILSVGLMIPTTTATLPSTSSVSSKRFLVSTLTFILWHRLVIFRVFLLLRSFNVYLVSSVKLIHLISTAASSWLINVSASTRWCLIQHLINLARGLHCLFLLLEWVLGWIKRASINIEVLLEGIIRLLGVSLGV